jgi:hypothetical protein
VRRGATSLVVLGLLLALGAPDASAVLCLKRSGQTLYRPGTCKRRERMLTAAEIGAQGPTGAPGDAGARQPATPAVVNAASRRIGTLVEGGVIVASPIDGRGLLVEIDAGGVLDRSSSLTLLYPGASCSGPAFMEDNALRFLRRALRAGDTVYYAGDPLPATTENAYAAEEKACPPGTPPTTPRGTCCTIGTVLRRAGPVQTFDAGVFGSPPFTLEP